VKLKSRQILLFGWQQGDELDGPTWQDGAVWVQTVGSTSNATARQLYCSWIENNPARNTHKMEYLMHCNFVRIYQTITSRLWEIGDIVDALEAWEAGQ
jgi:hypothetical protein